jgi:hypothetical protein
MEYPTIDEVMNADRYQICKWYRYLQSPGISAIGKPDFEIILNEEEKVMQLICKRFKKLGGFTPEISKSIGFK